MKTKIMGIVNVTEDSFYESSRTANFDAAISLALKLEEEGADIIDIGGESSRPQAFPIPLKDELENVIPVIQILSKKLKIPISTDTTKPQVAEAALDAGATLINDISGFQNEQMRKLARESGCRVCVMHMQGTPRIMQLNPMYQEGVVEEIVRWLDRQTKLLIHEGIGSDKIIIDPGIGFGKLLQHNLNILAHMNEFKQLGFPLLLGVSRKGFLSKITHEKTENLLVPTIAVNCFLALCDVDIIRVHDVKEHRQALTVLEQISRYS